jgi:hypothetical protein
LLERLSVWRKERLDRLGLITPVRLDDMSSRAVTRPGCRRELHETPFHRQMSVAFMLPLVGVHAASTLPGSPEMPALNASSACSSVD